jgi:hypothetical protein
MKVNYDGHEHEHELEPAFVLPEPLPSNEKILWQGSPDWRAMARRVFFLRALTIYFVAILAIRGTLVLVDGGTAMAALKAVLLVAPLAVLALGTLLGVAIMTARTAVYTITDKRVVMRIGIVLNVTFNLPFRRIASAGINDTGNGTGDITLALAGDDKIGFAHLWPHSRPWRLARPEPMLRCVPNAKEVGQILSRAWSESTGRAIGTAPNAGAESTADAARPVATPASGANTGMMSSWLGRDNRSGAAPSVTQGA